MVINHLTAVCFELEVSFMADVGINSLRKQKRLCQIITILLKQLYTIALFGLLLMVHVLIHLHDHLPGACLGSAVHYF